MQIITNYLDFMMHLDMHLIQVIQATGNWTYVILFIIVFCECGIIFTPFLPGESMLFAIGSISALGALNVHLIFMILSSAAILGGFFNFGCGHFLRDHIHRLERIGFVKRYLAQAHDFYARHGGKTIMIARLIPLIRTYAPFVAGVVYMNKKTFSMFNIISGIVWIAAFIYVSYFFGNIPIIKRNFSWVVLTIVVLSIIPAIIGIFQRNKSLKNISD